MADTSEVRAEIEAQTNLPPGTEGWWMVWGASVRDIQPGDYVLTADDEFYVQEVFESKNPFIRLGVVVDGERQVIGRGCRVKVLRKGTHHTLSPYVR